MKNKDNLHFSWTKNLSYNKTWNFVIGQRESGKSVDSWLRIWSAYHYQNRPSIVLRRRLVDITATYIDDIQTLLNKFLEDPIQLVYIKGDISNGVVDVRIGEYGVEYSWQAIKKLPVFIRVIGLSNPLSRIKSLMLPDLKYIFFDEFICNLRMGEKYLEDEFFRIQEIYTTFNREATTPIRVIAAGNPYSVFCPLFVGLEVNTSLLKPGAFIAGANYTISCFKVGRKLLKKIYEANPQYQFDDAYKKYAFGGEAVNDANIRIHKGEPRGSKLLYVFKMGNSYLSIHSIPRNGDVDAQYWVCKHNSDWARTLSKRRNYFVFNFGDLAAGGVIVDNDVRMKVINFKNAMNKRKVVFNCIDASYMAEDVYGCI